LELILLFDIAGFHRGGLRLPPSLFERRRKPDPPYEFFLAASPQHIQNELAEFALALDAGFSDGEYEPTPEELAGIDRGLRAAVEDRFASEQQVEAVFAKFRGK
jgi:hypothetical protein